MDIRTKEAVSRDIEGGDFTLKEGGIFLPKQGLIVGGYFETDIIRNGVSLGVLRDNNLVCNEGLTDLLEIGLGGGTQKPIWYIGLFEGNYTPLATVTAATITAASTESTAYDETVRQTWTAAAAASQSITNSASKATFTINDTKTMYGAFLVSSSVKSGTAGVLFAATRFTASRAVIATDELLVTYTVSAASA